QHLQVTAIIPRLAGVLPDVVDLAGPRVLHPPVRLNLPGVRTVANGQDRGLASSEAGGNYGLPAPAVLDGPPDCEFVLPVRSGRVAGPVCGRLSPLECEEVAKRFHASAGSLNRWTSALTGSDSGSSTSSKRFRVTSRIAAEIGPGTVSGVQS